ncbi:MAG: hypothetical protein ACRDHG_15585 [Anaerolineales bacterium]
MSEAPADRDPEEIEREQQLLWICGYKEIGLQPGSFYEALFQAALRADPGNLTRIGIGFPLVYLAVARWQQGILADWYGVN